MSVAHQTQAEKHLLATNAEVVAKKQAQHQAVANAQRHQPKAVKVVEVLHLMLQETAKVEVEEIKIEIKKTSLASGLLRMFF